MPKSRFSEVENHRLESKTYLSPSLESKRSARDHSKRQDGTQIKQRQPVQYIQTQSLYDKNQASPNAMASKEVDAKDSFGAGVQLDAALGIAREHSGEVLGHPSEYDPNKEWTMEWDATYQQYYWLHTSGYSEWVQPEGTAQSAGEAVDEGMEYQNGGEENKANQTPRTLSKLKTARSFRRLSLDTKVSRMNGWTPSPSPATALARSTARSTFKIQSDPLDEVSSKSHKLWRTENQEQTERLVQMFGLSPRGKWPKAMGNSGDAVTDLKNQREAVVRSGRSLLERALTSPERAGNRKSISFTDDFGTSLQSFCDTPRLAPFDQRPASSAPATMDSISRYSSGFSSLLGTPIRGVRDESSTGFGSKFFDETPALNGSQSHRQEMDEVSQYSEIKTQPFLNTGFKLSINEDPDTGATTARNEGTREVLAAPYESDAAVRAGIAAAALYHSAMRLCTHWLECHDANSGMPFYVNPYSQESTWDKPAEFERAEYQGTLHTLL